MKQQQWRLGNKPKGVTYEGQTPTKMIPGIRSGLVTSAKAREPVEPVEVREHDELERRRERIRDSIPSPACSAPAAGCQPQGRSWGPRADRSPPLRRRNLTNRQRHGNLFISWGTGAYRACWGMETRRASWRRGTGGLPSSSGLDTLTQHHLQHQNKHKKTLPDASLCWVVIL